MKCRDFIIFLLEVKIFWYPTLKNKHEQILQIPNSFRKREQFYESLTISEKQTNYEKMWTFLQISEYFQRSRTDFKFWTKMEKHEHFLSSEQKN